MNYKIFLFLILSISTNAVFAQKDGYWDNERATKREIIISARDRIVIKTEELPVGTTEVVYRITLLDDNQNMASSLASILKSIPDPTGISQGSAGAIFLLSKISGEDKCKYAIFSNEILASEYKKNGSTQKACFEQNIAVRKDAKRLTVENSLCILPKSNAIWFGFESKNWIMNQKIILEVIPWVNSRLSRGWTLENRKLIINQCKTSEIAKNTIEPDDFRVCVLNKLQKEYKFQEYQQLLTIEKTKLYKDFENACIKEMPVSIEVFADLRKEASKLMKQGKYGDAMDKITGIVENGMATAMDFNTLGYAYIMTKQYGKAIKFLKEGEKINDSELLIKMNLAHAYLLDNDYKSAKVIYKKYQNQNVNDSLSWTQKLSLDFETFNNAGLPSDDFSRVLRLF